MVIVQGNGSSFVESPSLLLGQGKPTGDTNHWARYDTDVLLVPRQGGCAALAAARSATFLDFCQTSGPGSFWMTQLKASGPDLTFLLFQFGSIFVKVPKGDHLLVPGSYPGLPCNLMKSGSRIWRLPADTVQR